MSDIGLVLRTSIAFRAAIEAGLLDAFGTAVDVVYGTTAELVDAVGTGAVCDVMIGTTSALVALGGAGIPVPVARAAMGFAVGPDATLPPLDTEAAVIDVLTAARTVAHSASGASGVAFAAFLRDRGLVGRVRTLVVEHGPTAAALLDGRADLAVQLRSELALVPGVHIGGQLPASVDPGTEFAVMRGARPTDVAAAEALVAHLTTARAAAVYRGAYLEV